jgi:hypothetical protein
MSLGFTEMLSIGASVLGSGIGGGGMPQTPQAPDINFTRYMRSTTSPSESEAVRFGESTSYSDFLRAWDSYLNNDYAEMSKRIIT